SHRERLGATHTAESRCNGDSSRERATKVTLRSRRERFVGTLQYSLRTDVDPGTGRHLPVHHQAELVQPVEFLPGCPLGNEVGVRNEYTRSKIVRAEHRHRFAGLHEKGRSEEHTSELQSRENLVCRLL